MTAAGFYHCSVKPVGRTNGRSVVAAAAYRSGQRLEDERTGEVFDYRARSGVVDTFILARDDAPVWAHDRARLWNEAERAEPRANGRLATEFELALPHELAAAQRKELLANYLRPLIERHGVAADVAIHAPGEGKDHRNIHAHVLITHRELGADGFGEIANQRTMTRKRKGREVQEKVAGLAATPADIKAIRRDWEQHVNRAYERAGLDVRVDHRSHEDRGIAQEPTKHLGPTATEMERRELGSSERGAANREIEARNAALRERAALEIEAVKAAAELVAAMQLAEIERAAEAAEREARAQAQGRKDDTRQSFEAAASRTTEPSTPNHDREAAEAAWQRELIDAAAQQAIGRRDDTRGPSEARQRPEPEAGREARAGAAEPAQAPPQPDATHELAATAATAVDRAGEGLGKIFLRGLASFIGWLADSIAPPPPPTRDQAERMARSAEEKQEARAQQEAQEAAHEFMLREFERSRQSTDQRPTAAELYGTPKPGGQERDNERERDRGYERER